MMMNNKSPLLTALLVVLALFAHKVNGECMVAAHVDHTACNSTEGGSLLVDLVECIQAECQDDSSSRRRNRFLREQQQRQLDECDDCWCTNCYDIFGCEAAEYCAVTCQGVCTIPPSCFPCRRRLSAFEDEVAMLLKPNKEHQRDLSNGGWSDISVASCVATYEASISTSCKNSGNLQIKGNNDCDCDSSD